MYNKSADGTKFHINCVKEYARVIYLESLDL